MVLVLKYEFVNKYHVILSACILIFMSNSWVCFTVDAKLLYLFTGKINHKAQLVDLTCNVAWIIMCVTHFKERGRVFLFKLRREGLAQQIDVRCQIWSEILYFIGNIGCCLVLLLIHLRWRLGHHLLHHIVPNSFFLSVYRFGMTWR